MKKKDKKMLEAIVNLKAKDIQPSKRELFKELEKPLKALAKSLLK
jgi:hypothetical protein